MSGAKRKVVAVAVVVSVTAAAAWLGAWRMVLEVRQAVAVLAPRVEIDQVTGVVTVPACAAVGPCTVVTAWDDAAPVQLDVGLDAAAWAAVVEVVGPVVVNEGAGLAGVGPAVIIVESSGSTTQRVKVAREVWTDDGTAALVVGSVAPNAPVGLR